VVDSVRRDYDNHRRFETRFAAGCFRLKTRQANKQRASHVANFG